MFREKFAHEFRDFVSIALQCKVSCVGQMKVDSLKVPLVGLGAGRWKDLVVPPPHNQCRRLAPPEVLLPFRVEWRVASVAQEQVELDFVIALAIEQILV